MAAVAVVKGARQSGLPMRRRDKADCSPSGHNARFGQLGTHEAERRGRSSVRVATHGPALGAVRLTCRSRGQAARPEQRVGQRRCDSLVVFLVCAYLHRDFG
jgi:hypothetical protein